MVYTLDTNFVAQLLNSNQNALTNLRNALMGSHEVVINAICYYEIERGLVLPTFRRKRRAFDLLVRKHGLLDLDRLALDEAVEIYQTLRQQGNLIADADLLMGAIARANGATRVTHNMRHFQRIAGLTLEDWQ